MLDFAYTCTSNYEFQCGNHLSDNWESHSVGLPLFFFGRRKILCYYYFYSAVLTFAPLLLLEYQLNHSKIVHTYSPLSDLGNKVVLLILVMILLFFTNFRNLMYIINGSTQMLHGSIST